jgi:hypothetical protein
VLGLAPLAFMIFWLIRVRMRNWYKGKRSSIVRMHRGHEAAPL